MTVVSYVASAALIAYMTAWFLILWGQRPPVVRLPSSKQWRAAPRTIRPPEHRALPLSEVLPPTEQLGVTMARPLKYTEERVQMQVRIPPKLRKRLQKEADRRYVSKCLLVEAALTQSLDHWEHEDLLVTSK